MKVFQAVKQSVTTRQAAETYGIRVNRNGMCVCPFHVVATSSTSLASGYSRKLTRSTAAPLPTKSSILREPCRTPSMKVDRRFHCFGCQADGDVIDFTAKLFGMNSKGAAVKLAADFGIPYEERTHDPPRTKPKPKISAYWLSTTPER